jgi:hypothetical protein
MLGQAVGVENGSAHRLVMAAHAWQLGAPTWGSRVCSPTLGGGWRSEWTLAGVGRVRKALIVAALPELLAEYAAAVTAAGKHETHAGRRVLELARAASSPA